MVTRILAISNRESNAAIYTYVLQYKTTSLPKSTRLLPASSKAFSSACIQRHRSKPVPHRALLLQRSHPPSLQLRSPRGVPLYPVATTRESLTRMHPTRRFIQFDRRAAKSDRCMKYVSHDGRRRSPFVRSRLWSVNENSDRDVYTFVILTSAIETSWYRGVLRFPDSSTATLKISRSSCCTNSSRLKLLAPSRCDLVRVSRSTQARVECQL